MPRIDPSLGLRARGSFVLPVTFEYDREPFAQLAGAYVHLNRAADALQAKKLELERDRLLTPLGKKSALADFVRGAGANALKEASAALDKAMDSAKAITSSMTLKGYDKTDVAAAMVRSEIRSHLRSLPEAKKIAMVAMGDLDEPTLHAIIEAPAALCGMTEDQRERVRHGAIALEHPDKAQALVDIDNASRVLKTAFSAATSLLLEGHAVTPLELDQAAGGRRKVTEIAREGDQMPLAAE